MKRRYSIEVYYGIERGDLDKVIERAVRKVSRAERVGAGTCLVNGVRDVSYGAALEITATKIASSVHEALKAARVPHHVRVIYVETGAVVHAMKGRLNPERSPRAEKGRAAP